MTVRSHVLRLNQTINLCGRTLAPGIYSFSRVWADEPPYTPRCGLLALQTPTGFGEFISLSPAETALLIRTEGIDFDAGAMLTTEDLDTG